MRKFIVLTVAVAFVLGCTPVFAGGGACQTTSSGDEKTIFQMVADSVNAECKVQPKAKSTAPKTPSLFQELSTSIKEGSAKAKGKTLRAPKAK